MKINNKNIIFKDTLKQQKKNISFSDNEIITGYTCGPTIYNYIHIGNARVFVFSDLIYRTLKYLFPDNKIIWMLNFTDIDISIFNDHKDKLLKLVDVLRITNTFKIQTIKDLNNLYCNNFLLISASDMLNEIMNDIDILRKKNLLIINNEEGVRLRVNNIKHLDHRIYKDNFFLWRTIKTTGWDLSYRNINGIPGWHIECASMIKNKLLQHSTNVLNFKIGGEDLKSPHHVNEKLILSLFNMSIQNFLHVNIIKSNNVKMSKSLKNYTFIKDLLQEFSSESVRLFLLNIKYSSTMNFTKQEVYNTQKLIHNIKILWQKLQKLNKTLCFTTHILKFKEELLLTLLNQFNVRRSVILLLNFLKHIDEHQYEIDFDLLLKQIISPIFNDIIGILYNIDKT